jgi:hypothetical protein
MSQRLSTQKITSRLVLVLGVLDVINIVFKINGNNICIRPAQITKLTLQLPNAGSREPIDGHNPNFILVRDFLISAYDQLSYSGTVLISAIDSPCYEGAFQFEKVASIAEFVISDIYPFDPLQFEGYVHTMTHQDGSAIDKNDKCATWIFTKK